MSNCILGWLVLGLIGWFIGTVTDMIFRKNVVIENPLWCLLGPIILYVAVKCTIITIYHKIRGV